MFRFPHYTQLNAMDCGPTCLRMIAKHFGKHYNLETLRGLSGFSKDGVSLLGISEAAEQIGFRTRGVKLTFPQLCEDAVLPAILHWNQNHFVVLPPQKMNGKYIRINDPGETSSLKLTLADFQKAWLHTQQNDQLAGIALLLEPTPQFYNQDDEEKEQALGWSSILQQLWSYKKYLIQLFMGLLLGSILQLILPFLTQNIVDKGINARNLQFVTIVLLAQAAIIFGRTVIEFIRSRILLFISVHINLAILSGFWIKLMHLPLSFFDTKQVGDTLQRIQDHQRIESFLTGSAISTAFSLVNFLIFSLVLLIYNWQIYAIFCVGSACHFLWIRLFLGQRRRLDYKRFTAAGKENSATMQLIYGMQEIRLNGAERSRRWEWENLQAALFKLSFKSLSLSQYQQAGAVLINESKNIVITFVVAKMVIDGELTLGAMMAVQSILGQLSGPIEQMISFVQQAQDAKMSLERLNEIHALANEEQPISNISVPMHLPTVQSIYMRQLTFTYPGAGNQPVLQNLDLFIPAGKQTAIVGMSGSGKTTLFKLLLQFYDAYDGDIQIGAPSPTEQGVQLRNLSPTLWRSNCGIVMQDGYIFSDSIARNIAAGDELPNYDRLIHACRMANILEYVEKLPLGFNTKIGAEGNGLSQGQKQRILIARAVYKDPPFLFFDEATNALDANNEKTILTNLQEFFKGRTVVVVAHRLSTVKHADQIIVLRNGSISEQGTHESLTEKRGEYYELVKNQLELGK